MQDEVEEDHAEAKGNVTVLVAVLETRERNGNQQNGSEDKAMFGIDAIVALGGLILPPAVDFIKKKFLKPESDTPEATMSSLATTKPDVLPAYVAAQVEYLKAQVDFFNRDVVGTPSQWIVDLRAAIRPFGVIFSLLILAAMVYASFSDYKLPADVVDTATGVRLTCELIVSSWFGTRIALSTK